MPSFPNTHVNYQDSKDTPKVTVLSASAVLKMIIVLILLKFINELLELIYNCLTCFPPSELSYYQIRYTELQGHYE